MLIEDLDYFKEKQNFKGNFFGLDKPNHPLQPKGWWEKYPIHNFKYEFNDWGFRGPDYSQYINQPVNICLGDSFTVNLGGPIEHSWPSQLNKLLDLPTINLGMDGAGNDSIRLLYDRALYLFDVQETFVMYSYFHRRLINKKFAHYGKSSFLQAPLHSDYENFKYFSDHALMDAHEAFLPNWCYSETELDFIDNWPHFDYPNGGPSIWANRDYHHMNKELNEKIARYYYELSSINS